MTYFRLCNGPARTAVYCLCCASLVTGHIGQLTAQTVASGLAQGVRQHTALYTRDDGVVFTRGAHGDLRADMYLPTQPGLLHATIVFLHGGAWKHGDRPQMEPVARAFAEHGYVSMAIDYDLTAQGDRFPLALEEAERAVQWLRENAARFHIDPATHCGRRQLRRRGDRRTSCLGQGVTAQQQGAGGRHFQRRARPELYRARCGGT